MIACDGQKNKSISSVKTIIDDTGRMIDLPSEINRIVSLSPSMTESIMAICPSDQLVGITQNCDYPEGIEGKAVVVTYPSLDIESIVRLKPDIIFTHEGMTQQNDLKSMEDLGIPVYVASYNSVKDIFNGLDKLGRITKNSEKSSLVIDSLKTIYSEIGKPDESEKDINPNVLLLVSTDPIFVYGENTLLSRLLMEAGGDNAVVELSNETYPQITREMLLNINPDVIVTSELDPLNEFFWQKYPEAKLTNAYLNSQLYLLKGNYHSRPGPRFLKSLEQLKEIIKHAQK